MTASKWGTSQWTPLALTAPDGTNLTLTRLLAVAVVADCLLFSVTSTSPPPTAGTATTSATNRFMTPRNMILSPCPIHVAKEEELADRYGNPVDDFSVKYAPTAGAASTPTCGAPRWRHRTSPGSRR